MAVVLPFNTKWPEYMVDQSGAASFQGNWIEVRKSKAIFMHVAWTAIASTAGTLSLDGSEDPTLTSIVPLTATATHGAQPSGGTAGQLIIVLENPPSFVRLNYVRSAGGGAAQFDAWAQGRSI